MTNVTLSCDDAKCDDNVLGNKSHGNVTSRPVAVCTSDNGPEIKLMENNFIRFRLKSLEEKGFIECMPDGIFNLLSIFGCIERKSNQEKEIHSNKKGKDEKFLCLNEQRRKKVISLSLPRVCMHKRTHNLSMFIMMLVKKPFQ